MNASQVSYYEPAVPPTPEPYRREWFINRDKEIELVDRKVEEGRYRNPITQPLLHFWGVMGIGKSWLLQWLAERYRFTPESRKERRCPTFTILFDFRQVKISLWQPTSVVKLLEQLARDLQDQLGSSADSAGPHAEAFQQCAEAVLREHSEVSELAERFVRLINKLADTFVPILVFDSAERLDGDVFFWLESHVLEPILRHDRAIVIIAGRKEIPRWREFSLRQRLVKMQLGPFSDDEAARQLEKRGYRAGKVIYPYSFGHPYATQVLGHSLAGIAGAREVIDEEFLSANHIQVAQTLRAVEDSFLLGVHPERQGILRALSILRKFNIESARHLLSEILGEPYAGKPDVEYLRLLEMLEDTNLVWWSSQQRGYVLDHTVRRLLNRRLQLQDVEEFIRRHEVAVGLYRKLISEYSKNCGPFLHEALYHLAQARMTVSTQEKVRDELGHLLSESLTVAKFATTGAVHELLLSLLNDPEFQESLPGMLNIFVTEKIRDFRDQLALQI